MYGKKILLSYGGDAAPEISFASEDDAKLGAELMWKTYGPPTNDLSIKRPFGSASVDGFDFDIEKVPGKGAVTFIKQLRNSMPPNKYLTATPMCARTNNVMETILNEISFNMTFVMFYNDQQCDMSGSNFNFEQWHTWSTGGKGSGTQVFLGAPAAESAGRGYLDAKKLKEKIDKVRNLQNFGGVMLWDASQAWQNGNYQHAVKSILNGTL